ncbi:hypothetical protein BKA80DRAFT_257996 [Phyllosticta citrichinensis]
MVPEFNGRTSNEPDRALPAPPLSAARFCPRPVATFQPRHARLSRPKDPHSTAVAPARSAFPACDGPRVSARIPNNAIRAICRPWSCLLRLAVARRDWVVSRATNASMRQPRHSTGAQGNFHTWRGPLTGGVV